MYLHYKYAQPRKLKILVLFGPEMYDAGLGIVLFCLFSKLK